MLLEEMLSLSFYSEWFISCVSCPLLEASSCVMDQIRKLIEVKTNVLDYF